MEIAQGGQLQKFEKSKLETIRVSPQEGKRRMFELWLNDDSVSYLTIDELLNLRDEINESLQTII